MIIEIDDILEGGDEPHLKIMSDLERRWNFGKCVDLQICKDGSMYAGRNLRQNKDISFDIDMDHFTKTRLQEVVLDKRSRDAPVVQEVLKHTYQTSTKKRETRALCIPHGNDENVRNALCNS